MRVSAQEIIAKCRQIAEFSESSTGITRPFLCPAMHDVHHFLSDWMRSLGMNVRVDAMGNLYGIYAGTHSEEACQLLVGSHLDTVPNAGAFDGVLGVVLGIALIESLAAKRLPFAIRIIGFSEEEGVRFGIPFLGSRAFIGRIDEELFRATDAAGLTVAEAIRRFGLNPSQLDDGAAHRGAFAYLEFHIEQGPVLESVGQPIGVVKAIAGQSRYVIRFTGMPNHAGTTPMHLRRDALAGAAEWIHAVEIEAKTVDGLVATVAALHSEPPAANVIAGLAAAAFDVRHAFDDVRRNVTAKLLARGDEIAARRNLRFAAESRLDQPSVEMDPALVSAAHHAVLRAGCDAPTMTSGAGHDAMIVADKIPSVMIFLRSPGGISHHPDESVLAEDVEMALSAGMYFVDELARQVS